MNDIIPNFDPIVIGDQIAALEAEAQDSFTVAKGVFATEQGLFLSRSEAIAAILWDVQQHHPEHLDAVCEPAKIGTSRRYELLQIGGGRKTIAQSRQETAARQAKFKAKKKAKQLAEKAEKEKVAAEKVAAKIAAVAKKVAVENAAKTTAEAAKQLAAAGAAKDSVTTPQVTEKPAAQPKAGKGESAKSKQTSLKQLTKFKIDCDKFKVDCDTRIPLMNELDQERAWTYLNLMLGEIKNVRNSKKGKAA